MGPVLYLYAAFLLFGFNVVFTCPDGYCRELAFPEFLFFAHKRLVNHNIETLPVNDFDMCQLRCYQNPNCVSINFNFNQDSQGFPNCDLNNATHKSHDSELHYEKNYVYHGTHNACDKASCASGGTCQSGYTDKGYRCLCPFGFTSAHCEQDIDECSAGKHNCSHVAACNNTIGSYNCACTEGYVGDGRNCSDVDECLTGKHNCSHVAVCNNIIGSYNCTCKEGYVGDGRNCSGCPEEWEANDKYCYKLYDSDRPSILNVARKKCQEMLADLPIVKSRQENHFIAGLMRRAGEKLVRLGMERKNGQLLWFDGISAEKTNTNRYNAWNTGPPNGKDCAHMIVQHENWTYAYCEYIPASTAPFVLCQKSRL